MEKRSLNDLTDLPFAARFASRQTCGKRCLREKRGNMTEAAVSEEYKDDETDANGNAKFE